MFNIVIKQQHQKLNVFRQWLGIIENDDVLHKRKIPNLYPWVWVSVALCSYHFKVYCLQWSDNEDVQAHASQLIHLVIEMEQMRKRYIANIYGQKKKYTYK